MIEKSSFASSTGNTKQIYGARSKDLWTDRNLFLSDGRCHDMVTSHGITASGRPSYKALLKADASGNGNEKAAQTTSKMDKYVELLKERSQIILEGVLPFCS